MSRSETPRDGPWVYCCWRLCSSLGSRCRESTKAGGLRLQTPTGGQRPPGPRCRRRSRVRSCRQRSPKRHRRGKQRPRTRPRCPQGPCRHGISLHRHPIRQSRCRRLHVNRKTRHCIAQQCTTRAASTAIGLHVRHPASKQVPQPSSVDDPVCLVLSFLSVAAVPPRYYRQTMAASTASTLDGSLWDTYWPIEA